MKRRVECRFKDSLVNCVFVDPKLTQPLRASVEVIRSFSQPEQNTRTDQTYQGHDNLFAILSQTGCQNACQAITCLALCSQNSVIAE
jgi:hypothetical protein